MKTIPVSIVIVSYNQCEYLDRAIDSVVNQTVDVREIIICDDCSTDGSRGLLKEYKQDYDNIKLIFQDENVGVTKNRNSGLKNARSKFISILDSDDWYAESQYLNTLYTSLDNTNYGWAYPSQSLTDKDGNFLRERINQNNGISGDIFWEIISKDVTPKGWMMRREALEDVGYLDEDMDLYEDWEFKIRLSHSYEAVFCPNITLNYRQHSKGLHNADNLKYKEEKRKVYNKILNEKIDRFPRVKENKGRVRHLFTKDFSSVGG